MTSYARHQQLIAESGDRFRRDTTNHQMIVLHHDGLYRHLRFAKPDTGMYHFDLVTWPGRLTICGDMPSTAFTFARETDMFEFFRQPNGAINPGYWEEKLISGRDQARGYSSALFRQIVTEHVEDMVGAYPTVLGPVDGDPDRPGLAAAVEAALTDDYNWEYEDGAREFLRWFEYRCVADGGKDWVWRFDGTEEWQFREFDYHYLWACHAIVWGIDQFDAALAVTR